MCIAIVTEGNVKLKDEWLYNSMLNNPDGAGIAYIDGNRVRISKGYMTYNDMQKEYDKLFKLFGDQPMLLHARIATAGLVNKDNCHPFYIRGGAMIHNGHLWSPDGGHNAEKSDTREFASIFYNILNFDDVEDAIENFSFDEAIGHDRMAFLYDDGRYLTAGTWQQEDGVLFSNGGYRYGRSSYALYDDDDHNYNYCMT